MDTLKIELPVAEIGIRLIGIIITFLVGQWLARNGRTGLRGVLEKQELPKSIVTLLANVTYAGLWLLTILTILTLLGVPIGTIFTGVALVLIILAIAMRETLGNFAATIIFALFKPFEAGDLIETANTMGVVQEIEMFNTVILSYDNKVNILPNALIQSNGLRNLSKMGKIRLDLLFNISYKDDVSLAKQSLLALFAADDRVLDEPAPIIFVKNLGDSGVELAAWPYVRTEDYYDLQFDVLEQGKYYLEEAGITIPFPQRDVHYYSSESPPNN
jgi:small conductance mechanosensitive channel